MPRSALAPLLLGLCAATLSADEPATRPITAAESVLAVYYQDHGLRSPAKDPGLILAAWPDGRVIWSGNRLRGGAPYRAGQVEPKKVAALLARFENDGLFADEKLNQARFGPDSEFITVLVKAGKRQVEMQSWHELFEESGRHVALERGAGPLDGQRRLDVLRKEPADYLFYRLIWSEMRGKLSDLIPAEGTPTDGKPVMKAGELSWHAAM